MLVTLREDSQIVAGTYVHEQPDVVSGWHHHDLHQLEYAATGVAEVETEGWRFLLPPRQAIWIPAGLRHDTTLEDVRSIAVFFSAAMVSGFDDRARVIAVSPLLREMMSYATRWPIGRATSDEAADAFFRALAVVITDELHDETPLRLPTSTDPVVHEAMAATRRDLTADVATVCAAVGTSPRTLRRRFRQSAGISWDDYRRTARLLRATAQLGYPDATVARVAVDVGFESVASFSRAFRAAYGESPSAYRWRVRDE